MENVLEEYLVKLGIQFDNNALKKAKGSIDDFKKNLEGMISKNVYATAAANFIGVVGAVTIEITKMVNQVAKADMQYQLLAQRMFMSVQATKAFTLASETMGHNLQEIAWNVELREKYFDLVDMVNKLEVPQESRDMLKQVRGIGHEFDRLKLAGKLATEWLAISLLNLNKGGVGELKSSLRTFTETVFEKIPVWTKQLADFLDVPIKLMGAVIKLAVMLKDTVVPPLEMIWGWFVKIWDIMKPAEKQFAILAGLLVAVFAPVVGPVATATAAITGLLLLLEDFFGYMEGKKSSEFLAPFWEIVLFIGSHLKKALYGGIIMAEHLWAKLTGKEHYSGKSFLQDYTDVMKSIDAEFKEGQQKRFDAIAEHEAKAKAKTTPPSATQTLGSISEREESGGRGAGTVSTGKGDKGGVSYGTYQLASAGGEKSSVAQFVKSAGYEKDFTGMVPGSKEFSDKWKQIAMSDPEFAKKQHEYIAKTHYAPEVEKLSKSGIDISKRGRGVQEAVWSTSVQYGSRAADIIKKALKEKDISSVSDAEMVSAIQDYKKANIATHFKSSSPAVQKSVASRVQREKQALLAMTRTAPGIKSTPAVAPPGSPAYAKAPESSQDTYNVNVTINAQTTDPKQIADEATRGVKKSIQELRKEKFNKVIRDRVAVS